MLRGPWFGAVSGFPDVPAVSLQGEEGDKFNLLCNSCCSEFFSFFFPDTERAETWVPSFTIANAACLASRIAEAESVASLDIKKGLIWEEFPCPQASRASELLWGSMSRLLPKPPLRCALKSRSKFRRGAALPRRTGCSQVPALQRVSSHAGLCGAALERTSEVRLLARTRNFVAAAKQSREVGKSWPAHRWRRRIGNSVLWWLVWPSLFGAALWYRICIPPPWLEAHVFKIHFHVQQGDRRKGGEWGGKWIALKQLKHLNW